MNPQKNTRFAIASIVAAAAAAIAPISLAESNVPGVEGIEAVATRVSTDYIRAKRPDGSFTTESYAFGKGGSWGGEISDPSIDKLDFSDVSHVIAPALLGQSYVAATDPKATRLLIMVYWGTTAVPPPYEDDPLYYNYRQCLDEYQRLIHQGGERMRDEANNVLSSGLHQLAMENRIRDLQDFKNAAMIGYDSSGLIGTEYGRYLSHTALGMEAKDEMDEIEQNRYFVVLMAYDFQLMWKEKKHKLLWETRFSINQRHNRFDSALPAMAQYAAHYFGQPTNGLVKKRVLDGRVDVGAPTLVQFVPSQAK
jgi:hypothetical protein